MSEETEKKKYLVKLIGGYALSVNAYSLDHAKGLAEGMALASLKDFKLARTEAEEVKEEENSR